MYNTVHRRLWKYRECDTRAVENLSRVLSINPVVSRLLVQRGIKDVAEAQDFLYPTLAQLHDPFQLADLDVAVNRLLQAIANRELIAIHGDYDVDGITSTVILRRTLELLGANVVHFIPDRLRDGYGLEAVAVDRFHHDGVRLVVSVDCGIRRTPLCCR